MHLICIYSSLGLHIALLDVHLLSLTANLLNGKFAIYTFTWYCSWSPIEQNDITDVLPSISFMKSCSFFPKSFRLNVFFPGLK